MKVPKIVPVLVLATAGAAWWYFSRPEPLPEGTVATSGTVEATDAQLGFQVPGRLLSLGPREGDRVAAGDELAGSTPPRSKHGRLRPRPRWRWPRRSWPRSKPGRGARSWPRPRRP